MTGKWLVSRWLCISKLDYDEKEKLKQYEILTKQMAGSNQIIKMFFGNIKVRALLKMSMPSNTDDLFFTAISCAPKMTIEVNGGKKNIGGTDILKYFDSGNIVSLLHQWDKQLEIAKKDLWSMAIFETKKVSDNIYEMD